MNVPCAVKPVRAGVVSLSGSWPAVACGDCPRIRSADGAAPKDSQPGRAIVYPLPGNARQAAHPCVAWIRTSCAHTSLEGGIRPHGLGLGSGLRIRETWGQSSSATLTPVLWSWAADCGQVMARSLVGRPFGGANIKRARRVSGPHRDDWPGWPIERRRVRGTLRRGPFHAGRMRGNPAGASRSERNRMGAPRGGLQKHEQTGQTTCSPVMEKAGRRPHLNGHPV